MQYRPFGKLDFKVSALGFGCMRLPTIEANRSKIDEPEATRMLLYAIDNGVNYLDTGYPYHDGESERLLGRVLQDGYRERVKLATKLLVRIGSEASAFHRLLNEQLERLQTDHVDVYLLHGLRKNLWDRAYEVGVLDWLEKTRADGRIRAVGFSFHDTFETFKEIIDAYDGWNMCQIQYNYMNETYQAGTRGVRYAASKGLAVVVMEPLLGGRLVTPPQSIQHLWDTTDRKRSPVEWALQWLWDQPEISLVLSGMSAMQQVQENVARADRAKVASLTQAELDLISTVRDTYALLSAVPCTSCGYCMPCPNGVDIPRNLSLLNSAIMYDSMSELRGRYMHVFPGQDESVLASSCIQCPEGEDKGPQGTLT